MGQKKRQRTAQYHLSDLDRQALGLAEDDIYNHNFKKLLDQGVIVKEKGICNKIRKENKMLRIIVDRGQSGGDQVKIVDTNETVLASAQISSLPERDNALIWEIGLDTDQFGSLPAIWYIKDIELPEKGKQNG